MDDVLLFGIGAEDNMKEYASFIEKYKKSIGMLIITNKYLLAHKKFSEELVQQSKEILSYPTNLMSTGFNYLGFSLESNSYAF